jgi:predicted nucleotidyltransferase
MNARPIDLLFNAYRRQVLALLLMRPNDSVHVRELARLTGVPAGSLHRELRLLSDAGLLSREPAGNQVRYRANREAPLFPELAAIFRKTLGLADRIAEALAPMTRRVEAAFVFGSVARGEENGASDVDLFVVGDVRFDEVVAAVAPLREILGRQVNPVVMTRGEFDQQRDERFVKRVLSEPKLFVHGNENDLG